jgi:four helix bundle protein
MQAMHFLPSSREAHFAHYLYIARGASQEICTQLVVAHRRNFITVDECAELKRRYDEIAKMLTGLIRYLEDSGWTRRL